MAAARRPLTLALRLLAFFLCAEPLACHSREPERRFAEYKRCADPECSMLMCRGKAVKDFKGPDCRFLDFKEGESIYVYYKLTGRTNELWAGSVGNKFGYFPKDLLEINHIYTHDELELITDETDFVCFDGGNDDFDNYDVDELLKISEDMEGGNAEDELETEEEEDIEWADSAESIGPDANSFDIGSEEESKDNVKMNEQVNVLLENTENVEEALDSKSENPVVNSDTENPQGDQSAQKPFEKMLQETMKVPKHESAKNSSLSQGEAKKSDYRGKEVSEDLKTTFGSTADAFVSDDETTSLITSLDGESREDLDIDTSDTKKLKEPKEQSEEIPLLPFERKIKSSDPPETENMSPGGVFESKASVFNDDATAEAELIHEKKDDSGLLTHLGDKFFAIVSGGERTGDEMDENKADFEEDSEDEDDDDDDSEDGEDDVVLISKNENIEDALLHSESSAEYDPFISEHDLLEKKSHNTDTKNSKEEMNKRANHKGKHEDTQEEQVTEEMESTSTHNMDVFSSFGDDQQPKATMETEEKNLKPPLGDIKDDPEGLSLHKIMKEKEREEKNMEDRLENDTKHKTLWEKIGHKKEAKQPMNFVPDVLEELTNESQSEFEDADFTEGKAKYGGKEEGEDFEPGVILGSNKQSNDSGMENIPTEKDIQMSTEQSQQETVTQDLEESEEEDEEQDDYISSEKTLEKKSILEKSGEGTHLKNLTQQNTVHNEAEDLDRVTEMDENLEKSHTEEFKPEETEMEEGDFLEESEEELLQDENAMSAKLSKERLTDEQGFPLDVENTSPQLQMPNGAISRVANPVDETGEEAIATLEQPQKEDGMEDLNEKLRGMQIREESQQNEDKDEKQEKAEPALLPATENSLVEGKSKIQDVHDKTMSSNLNFSVLDDKDDINQIKEHDFSQRGLKELETSTEGKYQHSHDPRDVSENTNEVVESEYSESVRELIIMKEFLDEKRIARLKKYLGQQHVFRIESLFHDMELELLLAQKHNGNYEDTEKALDQILESSESNILDVLNKALDSREMENKEEVIKEVDLFDEEAALMDDVQELMYSLRQKYSPISESAPLVSLVEFEMDSHEPIKANEKEIEQGRDPVESPDKIEPKFLRNIEKTSDKEDILELGQPEEDDDILAQAGTSDETGFRNVLESHKRKPDMATTLESVDPQTGEDLIAGLSKDKGDTMKDSNNPSEVDSAAPHFPAAFDGAILLAKENMQPLAKMLVSTLPEAMQPGPDFHGLPWEPIIITAFVGFATLAIFFWRTCLSVKSRMYQVTEKQLVEKISSLMKEKTEILEKMSEYDQKIKEAKESVKETQKQNSNLSDETAELKDTVRGLKETNHLLDDRVKNLNTMLEIEREHNAKKKEQLTEAQKTLEKLQETITFHSAELSEVQLALNEAKLNEEKLKSDLHRMQEENVRLKKSKEQLLQEAEGWSERHTESTEQIKLYQKSQKDMEEALAYKENEIEVLTNCIMQLKQLDADSESENKKDEGSDLANGEITDTRNEKMKNQIKQMMDVSRVKTTLSIIEEERDSLRSKLNDEVASRHELEEQIKKLEHDSSSLQSVRSQLESECRTLQQKVEILNELYQQKEMALQKKLTQEEYDRQEKEQKLSAADEKAILAVEEVKVYKQRIQEIEEELQKTERSYKNQIAAHEKKAHDNWLIARSAERALAEEKREAANLRQKLIEVNQKIAALQRPIIVKPTAGRPDHQIPPRRGPLSRDGSFGPSPVSGGAPSPPLMMEPPGRPLSANPREGSRSEFSSTVIDGPPAPRRHLELSGRMSAPDLGPAVAALINSGPRTSSPSAVDGMQNLPREHDTLCVSTAPSSSSETTAVTMGSKGPPSFPGHPMMTSPGPGPLPPPVRFGPPPRAPYGSRPLPLARGAPPPPLPRDYPPGPPFGIRDFPPGSLPPPEQRAYIRGPPPFRPPPPRDFPPGPRLPPQGLRDYPPLSVRDLPPSAPNEYQGGPPCPPSPANSRDSAHHPEQKP
uniref:Transport and Golgi organization protein 1 homolog isoform X1 n=1 Tax=Pogona vitticeps TaxID=103695 RepID=A0A6J0T0P7_9SAUR